MYYPACKPNSRRDVQKDRRGQSNLVALYRRTRKGHRQVVRGQALGGVGVDGSDYYELRLGADGILYCSCPDYLYRGHRWNQAHPGQPYACKHVVAALAHYADMVRRGVAIDSEMIVYRPEVLLAEAERRATVAQGNRAAHTA